MGWLPVVLGGIACFVFYTVDELLWLAAAALASIGALWSWGIMHNFAMEAAKRRSGFRGDFYDVSLAEANAVPDWIARTNLAFALTCLVLFIIALVFAF